MFSALATCYLFLGGAGAGLCTALSVFELMDLRARRRMPLVVRGYGPVRAATGSAPRSVSPPFPRELFAYGWPLCFAVLGLGVACLLFDVGRLDRLSGLLASPTASPLSFGVFGLCAAMACAAAFGIRSLSDAPRVSRSSFAPRAPIVALGVIGVASGLVVAAYTGVLLYLLASVLAWRTLLVPVLFVLSSLSCGIGLVFAVLSFADGCRSLAGLAGGLARADSALIVLEAAVLTAFVVRLQLGEGTALAASALVAGDSCGLFWLGVVVAGLALPFAWERDVARGRRCDQRLLPLAACVLAGGLALRVCVAGLAAYDATQAMVLL